MTPDDLDVPDLEFGEEPSICEFEHDDLGLLMKGMKYHSSRNLEKPGPGPTGNPVGQGELAMLKESAEQKISQLEIGHESTERPGLGSGNHSLFRQSVPSKPMGVSPRKEVRPNSVESIKRDVLIHKKYDTMKASLGYTDEDFNGASPVKRTNMRGTPVTGDLKLKLFNVKKGVSEVTSKASMVASIKASHRDSGMLAENSANPRVRKSQTRHSYGGDSGPVKSGEIGYHVASSILKKMVVKRPGPQTGKESFDYGKIGGSLNRSGISGLAESQRLQS